MLKALIERPTDTTFESQQADETVYFLLRKHPITNLGWIINSIILVLLPPAIMAILMSNDINTFDYINPRLQMVFILLWYLVIMFVTFESFIDWYFNVYIITDKRLIDVDFKGLWNKRISETSLGQIEDATYQTNRFWQILFDYGDISVQTAAEKTEFEFNAIPKPGLVHDKFTDLVEEFKNKHGR